MNETEKTGAPETINPRAAGVPLVSVVVRTCNRPELLKKALASIQGQAWEPIEIVLVNDGNEPLVPMVDTTHAGLKIRVVEHDGHKGRSKAANNGMAHSSGAYICFLDDDDLFLPGHVESLVSLLERDPSVDAAYTGVQCIDESGNEIGGEFNDPFDAVRLRAGNYIPFNALMFRRSLLDKGVKIDEQIDLYEDWDFLLQLLDHTEFAYINEKTALYRIADASGFGKSRDTDKVEAASCLILDKWRDRWSTSDLREMTKRAWQFGALERLHTECCERELSYQDQIKGFNEREASSQEQLKGHRNREQSYQEQLKGYHNRELSHQTQLQEYQTQLQGYQVQVAQLEAHAGDLNAQLEAQLHAYLEKTRLLNTVLSSASWRITAPLRTLKSWIKKSPVFRLVSKVRRRTEVKKAEIVKPVVDRVREKLYQYRITEKPVPCLTRNLFNQAEVKILAFYLPQFHTIPENDEWWGKGFTEWTNVKPAKPQFEGHYQPHVPGDLRYYDLLEKTIWQQQVDIAKTYGIGGFCFYFYWFAGKRLLEQPLLNYLDDPSLDFPFCLAWANENWSRRWDGLDNDILIRQDYSDEDDLNFICYLSKYLADRRYIRINNKPLVIIYRPNLLPSARETAKRWRNWCLEHGIGEIFLASVQSFDQADPREYGFDGSIEFPPNNSAPPNITKQIPNKKQGFSGAIFDWRVLPERSYAYRRPAYKLFRGVNPSWDNTARKKQNGLIFLNSSPFGYLQWLYNALADTIRHEPDKDARIVFVNAWNEWAEGAHLEPDQRYGYAFLEATGMALCRASLAIGHQEAESNHLPESREDIAVIIHAYYLSVFKEIIERLRHLDQGYKIFVTTPPDNELVVREILEDLGRPYKVLAVENHGRDVLPFLKVIPFVVAEKFPYFVKVHTKKSIHRGDGDIWRDDLYNKLLDKQKIAAMVQACEADRGVGLVGPSNHIVHMTTYLGSNEDRVKWYSERLGFSMEEVLEIPFVAGTMFFARTDAIMPLLSLAILAEEFEAEAGHVDGTLAHAIERLFSVSAVAAGFRIIDTDSLVNREETPRVSKEYAFVN